MKLASQVPWSLLLAASMFFVSAVGCSKSEPDKLRLDIEQAAADMNASPPPAWPDKGAPLAIPEVAFPEGFGERRVYLDAGHGTPGNPGNTSSLCVEEHVYTLRLACFLAGHLENTGHFRTRLGRTTEKGAGYRERLKQAEAWQAGVILSLHSDVRGEGEAWSPAPQKTCMRNLQEPGFAVLWADKAEPALVARRRDLARAIATRMSAAGFPPYHGADYEGLYEADGQTAGVFVDRHAPGRRIFFLNRPPMPSVVIETHNAWDPREERRWAEEHTMQAFGAAVTAALLELFYK